MSDLDRLLVTWASRTNQADLHRLEPQVWARINARAPTATADVLGFRLTLAASVMAIGVIVGGASSATAGPATSPFASHPAYAPSTLLEGDR